MQPRFALAEFWGRRRTRRAVAFATAIASASGLAFVGYMELMKAGFIKYNEWDRRDRGALRVGQPAPDLELPLLDEGSVRLSELWRERPVFLVFGSCT